MFDPLSVAIGLTVGALGGVVGTVFYYRRYGHAGSASGSARLAGKILPESVGSSAPQNLLPKAGFQSRADYEWGYLVGPGDTAGSIAEAITGDDGRYQELLLVNPEVKAIGTPGVFMGDAWDFASLSSGEHLALPLPWSRFIDQLGNPRGGREPFPLDPRASSEAVEGAHDAVLVEDSGVSARKDRRVLTAGGPAPYGARVMFDEEAA